MKMAQSKAEVRAQANNGNTSLILAAEHGHFEVVEKLLRLRILRITIYVLFCLSVLPKFDTFKEAFG